MNTRTVSYLEDCAKIKGRKLTPEETIEALDELASGYRSILDELVVTLSITPDPLEMNELDETSHNLKDKLQIAYDELKNISTADFKKWDEGMDNAEEFVKWAQSRSRNVVGLLRHD